MGASGGSAASSPEAGREARDLTVGQAGDTIHTWELAPAMPDLSLFLEHWRYRRLRGQDFQRQPAPEAEAHVPGKMHLRRPTRSKGRQHAVVRQQVAGGEDPAHTFPASPCELGRWELLRIL